MTEPKQVPWELRGQVYNRLDPISVHEHDTNGGGICDFLFDYAEKVGTPNETVHVFEFEPDEKRGHRVSKHRAFYAHRVVTDQDKRESRAMARSKRATATKERTPKVGVCEYTGGETKGGHFLPGMDAALKGALLTAARNGDSKAAAELIQRGWPTKDIEKAVLAEGRKLASDEFLTKRVAARLRAVSQGKDPYTVVTGIAVEAA